MQSLEIGFVAKRTPPSNRMHWNLGGRPSKGLISESHTCTWRSQFIQPNYAATVGMESEMRRFSHLATLFGLSAIASLIASGQNHNHADVSEHKGPERSPRSQLAPRPGLLTDSMIVPVERQRAFQKLFSLRCCLSPSRRLCSTRDC